jgi:hypothetical protein
MSWRDRQAEVTSSITSSITTVNNGSNGNGSKEGSGGEGKQKEANDHLIIESHPYLRDWYRSYRRHWFLCQHRAPVCTLSLTCMPALVLALISVMIICA